MKSRLDILKSGGSVISPQEQARINNEYEASKKNWGARKKMFYNVFNAITENYDGDCKALLDSIGVEDDRDLILSIE